jgi:D-alanine transaminase
LIEPKRSETPVPLADWNGVRMPLSEVRVSVLDRSFLFGDAIYEVLRVYKGKPFQVDQHFDRLRASLNSVRIAADVNALRSRMHALLEAAGVEDGVIYMHVTRGEAPRTHHFPYQPTRPNELIYVTELREDPYAVYRTAGAKVITVPDIRWKRCDIKSVNLLANCLAAQQAVEAGCQEAIFYDEHETITEGAHTSVFGVSEGQLLTAPLEDNILPGITRLLVVDLARDCDIAVIQHAIRLPHLAHLDELFITGTTAEILPVVSVDGRPIGNGQPGPVTTRLAGAYRKRIEP